MSGRPPAAWPPGLAAHLVPLSAADRAAVAAGLALGSMAPAAVVARRVGHVVGTRVPAAARVLLTAAVKRVRRVAVGAASDEPPPPLPQVAPGRRLWNGRRAAVVLSHDLDTPACVAALDAVLAVEAARGLRSLVHVLAGAGYPVSAAWLEGLAARGVEVGLHGWDHDYALGSRPPAAIRRHLARALERLAPLRPRFYRAPAFGLSARLAREVVAAGFRCDSSRTVYHPAYRSTRSLLPYRPLAPESDLWELPVALEDSWLFRDWKLAEARAIAYCNSVLARAIESGGVVVLATHPSILTRRPGFYPRLLDGFLATPDVWIAPAGALLDCCDALCAA